MSGDGVRSWVRFAPVAIPAAVGLMALTGGHAVRAVVAGGVAAAMALLLALGVPVDRYVSRAGAKAAAFLGRLVAAVVGVGVVGVGGILAMAGIDPLDDPDPASGESTWVRRGSAGGSVGGSVRGTATARRAFAFEGGRRSRGRQIARTLGVAFTVIGMVAVAVPAARTVKGWFTEEDRQGPPIAFPAWAYPDAPWVAELHEAGWPVGYHPALGWQSTDIRSPYLNVASGVRRSWRGPDGGDRPSVWFLGGSTMYGLGQRDDHTIASEVARLAADAGHPIDAVNLGVPGYDQWQEVALMGFRLSRGERPDLVVVYDGANDLQAMAYRAQQGIRPLDEPPNRFHEAVEQQTRYRPERRGSEFTEAELRDAFVRMYGAGVDLARRTGAAYGVPVVSFWQPTASTTLRTTHDGPVVAAMPEVADDRTVGSRERNSDIVRRLGDGIVDLTGSVDHADAPVFIDQVHTNELGAALVAVAMWPTVADRLTDRPSATEPR